MPSLERISHCFLVTSFNLYSSPTFVILSFLMIFINLGIHISSVSRGPVILPNSISLSLSNRKLTRSPPSADF